MAAKRYNALDVLRFVCALFVVGIHAPPFEALPLLDMGFSLITRNAVPLFFFLSAYFFFLKDRSGRDVYVYARDKVIMYLFWTAVYLAVAIFLLGKPIKITPLYVLRLFSRGGYDVMWFLQALIFGVPTVYFMRKYMSGKAVVGITAVIYAVAVCLTSYYPIFEKIPFIPAVKRALHAAFGLPTGLLYGLLFIALGMYAAQTEGKRAEKSLKQLLCEVIFSFMLLAVETLIGVMLLKTSQTVLWFSMIPCTLSVFELVKSISLKDRPVYTLFRNLSVVIYVIHKPLIYLLEAKIHGFLLFAVVSLLSVIIAWVAVKLKGNRKWIVI